MVSLFGILVGIFILVLLVVVHELGHAIVARRNGVVVEEFGIGFPPLAWKKKLKNGILLTLNWLPLGGYVKLQGEHDAADKKGDYGAVTFESKSKILLAGVYMNWVVAAVLFTGLAFFGIPKVMSDQFSVVGDTTIIHNPIEITSLTQGHAAEKSGIQIGDKIIRFAGQEVPSSERLIELTKENKGKNVEVVYDRSNIEHSLQATLGDSAEGGYFGAGLGQRDFIKATWSAPIVGIVSTAQFSWLTLQGVGSLIGNLVNGVVMQFSPDTNTRNQASTDLKVVGDSVAGPIGILGTIFPAAQQAGFTQLIFLTAVISLSLAVMNILPIPALDGGRWFTMAIFKISRKKLTRELEEKIQTVGFSILMGLTILVTFADVTKLF